MGLPEPDGDRRLYGLLLGRLGRNHSPAAAIIPDLGGGAETGEGGIVSEGQAGMETMTTGYPSSPGRDEEGYEAGGVGTWSEDIVEGEDVQEEDEGTGQLCDDDEEQDVMPEDGDADWDPPAIPEPAASRRAFCLTLRARERADRLVKRSVIVDQKKP